MVYDFRSDRFILFGGSDVALSNETWSYDFGNNSWTKMRPSRAPSAREGHTAVYDFRADRVILFGGYVGTSVSRETWAYAYEADTWTNMSPAAAPPDNFNGVMVYDSESDRVVLFGGTNRGAGETWAYDFNANSWMNMTPGETVHPSVGADAMDYDSRADRVILFGGQTVSYETWAYDFNTNTWTNMNPVTKPSWRDYHAMDYDIGSDRIVLFGGFAATGINNETWTYDFNSNVWTMMTPPSGPQARSGHALAYDIRLGRSVLYGGDLISGSRSHELWTYDLGTDTWSRVDPPRPSAPTDAVMAYDARWDRVILFGGFVSPGWSQTWAYDLASNVWSFMNPTTQPRPTYGPRMAYDERANLTILFGEYGTWAYDFGLNAWTPLNTGGSPSARNGAAMAYDSESDRTILFGGDTSIIPSPWVNDTWAYDFNTNTWTNMTPGEAVRPPPGSGNLMTYDSRADRMILFGGSTGASGRNETWAYDFNTNSWTNKAPVVSPPTPVGQAMAYDASIDRVILNGASQTWTYDFGSNAWTNRTAAVAPSLFFGQAMVYHPPSNRTVLFAYDDTWWGRLLAPPTPPTAIRVTVGAGRFALAWQPPIDDGGAPISAYRIYRGSSSGAETLYAEIGNVLTYVDVDVTSGVDYYYQISALTGLGEGQKSVEVTSLPPASPPSEAVAAAYTLVLLNHTLIPGNFRGANGGTPQGAAYDIGKAEIFVANTAADTVSVISDATHAVVATVQLPQGSNPFGLAYDAGTSEVFVGNSGSDTVSVISDVANTVVATIQLPRRSSPQGLAYVAGKGEVFVANSGTNTVSVVSDVTNTVIATIPLRDGSSPRGVVYDSGKGEVFVAEAGWYTVSVISDTTNSVIATIPVGALPRDIAYDAGKGEIFVANSDANTVSVISDDTNTVISTIPVAAPGGIAYDGAYNEVFVASFWSNNVTVISDTTNTVIANISVGALPLALAYDGGRGEIYVTNRGADTVSVISDSTNAVVTTISVDGNPFGVAYDAGTRELFVAQPIRDIVSVISDAANPVFVDISLPAGSSPWALAYDSGRGEVFVVNQGSNTVSVISDTTHTVVATIPVPNPVGLAYDSAKGEVFVVSGNTISVISDSTNTVVATIPFPIVSNLWGVVYDGGKREIFVGDQGRDTIYVISDQTNTVVASISQFVGWGPVGLVYDDRKGEIFYANVNSNDVRVISDETNAVVANIRVGSRPMTVAYDGKRGEIFVADSASNTVSVISDATNTVVATATGGGNPTWATYDPVADHVYVTNNAEGTVSILSHVAAFDVVFTQSGLPPSTPWSVTLDGTSRGSTGTQINFDKPNGTYSFHVGRVPGYSADPSSGQVAVSGANVTLGVTFSVVRYAVTITEAGLPAGRVWWVNLSNGESFESASSSVTFAEPIGTYGYSLATMDKRYSAPGRTFLVIGSPLRGSVTFSPVAYAVTFSESGLQSGVTWSVSLDGSRESATGSTIAYSEMNGTYSYTINVPDGYTANPESGNLTVRGASVATTIRFVAAAASPPSDSSYLYIGVTAAVVGAAAGALIWIRRKRTAPPER